MSVKSISDRFLPQTTKIQSAVLLLVTTPSNIDTSSITRQESRRYSLLVPLVPALSTLPTSFSPKGKPTLTLLNLFYILLLVTRDTRLPVSHKPVFICFRSSILYQAFQYPRLYIQLRRRWLVAVVDVLVLRRKRVPTQHQRRTSQRNAVENR